MVLQKKLTGQDMDYLLSNCHLVTQSTCVKCVKKEEDICS